MREDVVGLLELAESEGPMDTIPNNTTTKEPSSRTEILDVEAGGKAGLEVAEEGHVTAYENAIVDVDG